MEQKEITLKINGKGFKKLSKNINKLKNDAKGLNEELQQTIALLKQLRDYQKYEEDD